VILPAKLEDPGSRQSKMEPVWTWFFQPKTSNPSFFFFLIGNKVTRVVFGLSGSGSLTQLKIFQTQTHFPKDLPMQIITILPSE